MSIMNQTLRKKEKILSCRKWQIFPLQFSTAKNYTSLFAKYYQGHTPHFLCVNIYWALTLCQNCAKWYIIIIILLFSHSPKRQLLSSFHSKKNKSLKNNLHKVTQLISKRTKISIFSVWLQRQTAISSHS